MSAKRIRNHLFHESIKTPENLICLSICDIGLRNALDIATRGRLVASSKTPELACKTAAMLLRLAFHLRKLRHF
jgi:hypothetical protein